MSVDEVSQTKMFVNELSWYRCTLLGSEQMLTARATIITIFDARYPMLSPHVCKTYGMKCGWLVIGVITQCRGNYYYASVLNCYRLLTYLILCESRQMTLLRRLHLIEFHQANFSSVNLWSSCNQWDYVLVNWRHVELDLGYLFI